MYMNKRTKFPTSWVLQLFIAACLMCPSATSLANDALQPIINSCNECHGDNGVSTDDMVPTIAGIGAGTLEIMMFSYLDEVRTARTMNDTDMIKETKKLSEDQIVALAEHYSALPFVPAKQPFDAELAKKGAIIHEKRCDKCHSEGGSLAEDDASILAGQWMPYMREEIKLMQSGDRETDEEMVKILNGLKPEYIDMLLHYYASQQ